MKLLAKDYNEEVEFLTKSNAKIFVFFLNIM